MDAEFWTKDESGVLREEPLLLKGCRGSAFGKRYGYPGGCVEKALFTYLSGVPDGDFFQQNPDLFLGQYLVSMSPEWEQFLNHCPFERKVFLRRMMRPMVGASRKELMPLPFGYAPAPFDENAFSAHPFGHGENYADFEAFRRFGSGAVVRDSNGIVSSASSFLSFQGEVELDVSTAQEHRRKGLADHCVSAMLADCAARGITVHWDAQNAASAEMALSHGFQLSQDYAVVVLHI